MPGIGSYVCLWRDKRDMKVERVTDECSGVKSPKAKAWRTLMTSSNLMLRSRPVGIWIFRTSLFWNATQSRHSTYIDQPPSASTYAQSPTAVIG